MADLTPTPGAQVANGTYTLTNPLVGANGTAATAPRSDMRPTVPSPATPTTQAFGDAATSGAGTGFATDTHKHGMPAAPTGDVALAGSSSTPTATTSTSAVDLVTISGLSIAVTSPFKVEWNYAKDASAANRVATGMKVNSTIVYEADSPACWRSTATQQIEDGMCVFGAPPRTATTLAVWGFGCSFVTATGVKGVEQTFAAVNLTNPMPNATVTSIAIRGINNTANNNLTVTSVRILTGEAF